MKIVIEPMAISDYDEVYALWLATENVGLSGADTRESIDKYLNRNPGLSFVARDSGELVGAILGGHDGRRGFLHHLAVSDPYRNQSIGRELVDRCLEALRNEGIQKCHLFIFHANHEGIEFWKSVGWTFRQDISVMSLQL